MQWALPQGGLKCRRLENVFQLTLARIVIRCCAVAAPTTQRMDIREIARRAKVSTATVSRAINRVPTVDPQLAKRVWRVVDELGYYPNTQARALVSGRSRIFGLIVSEFTNPFFPEIVQTFENLAVENNYEILLTSTVNDPKRTESSVRRMIERRVDGVARSEERRVGKECRCRWCR